MDTIFMNSRISETSDPHRLLLSLIDKINLKRSDRYAALSNLTFYYTFKNVKESCKNNKFKILAPTWNGEFDTFSSYFASDIQDYFECILKSMKKKRLIILQ